MSVNTDTDIIFFGARNNVKRQILGIAAQAKADMPGLLFMQDVDDSAVVGGHWLWFDSNNNLRFKDGTKPTDQDSDGTAVGSGTGASKALDDLVSVAINADMDPGADGTIDLGDTTHEYKDLWIDGIAYIDDLRADVAEFGDAGQTDYIKIADNGVLTMEGASTIDGVATGNLVDKSAAEVITGGWDITTADLDIKEDSRKVTFGAAGSSDAYIEFDGSNLLFFDSDVASTVTLAQLQSGTTLNPVVSGDFSIPNGKFTWTDSTDETAGTFSFANTGAGADIDITSSATTGEVIKITADAMANGTAVLVDCDGGVGGSGFYFRGFDGSANDITIGDNGEVNIKGAGATDIVTIDAGHLLVTSGNITATLGNILATQGNITATLGNIVITAGNLDMNEGKMEIDSTADEISYIKRNNGTGTGPAFEIEETHVNGGVAFLVDSNVTDAVDAMQITHDSPANGLVITGTSTTGTQISFVGPASQTTSSVIVDGATGSWIGAAGVGMLHLTSDGTNANATAAMALITKTGQTVASMEGSALRIVDASTGGSTAGYAVAIDASGALEALHVIGGTVVADETIKATTGIITVNSELDVGDPPTQTNMDSAFGAGAAGNDGMIGIINDAGAGTNAWLCVNTDGAWYYAAKLTIGS